MTCPHGMPTPGSCLDCMDTEGIPKPKPQPQWETVAQYPTRACPGCGEPIEPGQRIILWDVDDRWRHQGCRP